MSTAVASWWLALCAVSVLNIAAWSLSAAALGRQQARMGAEAYALRRLLLLSAGYVFGCAFRSVFPVYDVQRMVVQDTWLSSVIVGRAVATVAELCFVAQWALLLKAFSRASGSVTGAWAARSLLPLILVAEVCSWYSVLTTSNLGHVIEESIWGLCAALLVASLVTIWPRSSARQRPILGAWCVVGVAYVGFMFMVDVPMYWSRWLADEASGRTYLSVAEGLADASQRWVVSHQWAHWKGEAVWMSMYFSAAVWLSIGLIHAPIPILRARAA